MAMMGHWTSQTRKLNRHWQSVKKGLYWMTKRFWKDTSFNMSPYYEWDEEEEEEVKMYKIEKDFEIRYKNMYTPESPFYDEDNNKSRADEWSGLDHNHLMMSNKLDFVNLGGDALEDLYDFDQKLLPGGPYILGFQMTICRFLPRDDYWNTDLTTAYFNNMDVDSYTYFVPSSNLLIAELNNQPGNSLIRLMHEYDEHDTTQLGNEKFIGSDFSFYSPTDGESFVRLLKGKLDVINVVVPENNYDDDYYDEEGNPVLKAYPDEDELCALIKLTQTMTDEQFNNLLGGVNRIIPKIGNTMILAPAIGGNNFIREYMYFVTPTIYNTQGEIADLS